MCIFFTFVVRFYGVDVDMTYVVAWCSDLCNCSILTSCHLVNRQTFDFPWPSPLCVQISKWNEGKEDCSAYPAAEGVL